MKINLPIWEGVKPYKDTSKICEFSLIVSEDGLIVQNTPKEIMESVLKKYSNSNYNHITTPPGKSNYNKIDIENRINKIKKFTGSLTNKKILEIGGANSFMAKEIIKNEKCESYTIIDPSIKTENKLSNLIVIKEYFKREITNEKYDIIICISCLEHVPNAVGFLSDIRSLLKEENSQSILFFPIIDQQFENGDINAIIHEHISYFTEHSANTLIKNVGFKIIEKEIFNDGGWFNLSYDNKIKYEKNELIQNQKQILEKFEYKLKKNINNFSNYISKNNNFIIFGACNGINSLLEISNKGELNITIVDSDDSKSGKYISSLETPILFKSKSSLQNNKTIIIAANSFYQQIHDDLINNYCINPKNIKSVLDL